MIFIWHGNERTVYAAVKLILCQWLWRVVVLYRVELYRKFLFAFSEIARHTAVKRIRLCAALFKLIFFWHPRGTCNAPAKAARRFGYARRAVVLRTPAYGGARKTAGACGSRTGCGCAAPQRLGARCVLSEAENTGARTVLLSATRVLADITYGKHLLIWLTYVLSKIT